MRARRCRASPMVAAGTELIERKCKKMKAENIQNRNFMTVIPQPWYYKLLKTGIWQQAWKMSFIKFKHLRDEKVSHKIKKGYAILDSRYAIKDRNI
jgi:hypothetical protein